MKKTIFAVAAVAIALLATSCKKGEAPKAMFSYEVNEMTVTFTNLSKNADSYKWEFGDGTTSNETSPVHEYAEAKTYNVTLTATNKEGNHIYTEAVTTVKGSIKMTIDGKFDDWQKLIDSGYAGLASYKNDMTANLDHVAMEEIYYATDPDYLYVFMVYDESVEEVMSYGIYIDADGNPETGKDRSDYWSNVGGDYFIEFGDEAKANITEGDEGKAACWEDWTAFQIWIYPEGKWIDESKNFTNQDVVKAAYGTKKCTEAKLPLMYFSGKGSLSNLTVCGARSCSYTWAKSGSIPAIVDEEPQAAPALKFVAE